MAVKPLKKMTATLIPFPTWEAEEDDYAGSIRSRISDNETIVYQVSGYDLNGEVLTLHMENGGVVIFSVQQYMRVIIE